MSKTKQPDKSPTPQDKPPISIPGIISAIVVVFVFVVLGVMLANRSSGQAATQSPTTPMQATAPIDMGLGGESTTEYSTTEPEDSHLEPTAISASDTEDLQEDTNSEQEEKEMYNAAPPMTIDPAKTYIATITTPRGDIQVKLRPDIAPIAVNNFVFLAREGFYDGLTWHRVIKGFMAQGGDPNGTGSGGPGYTIQDEFSNAIRFDRAGILAMARPNMPNSAGSQFFITTAPAPHLNNQYTAFGEVIEGQDIVNNIPLRDPSTATTPGEKMLKVTIAEQ